MSEIHLWKLKSQEAFPHYLTKIRRRSSFTLNQDGCLGSPDDYPDIDPDVAEVMGCHFALDGERVIDSYPSIDPVYNHSFYACRMYPNLYSASESENDYDTDILVSDTAMDEDIDVEENAEDIVEILPVVQPYVAQDICSALRVSSDTYLKLTYVDPLTELLPDYKRPTHCTQTDGLGLEV